MESEMTFIKIKANNLLHYVIFSMNQKKGMSTDQLKY